MTKTNKKTRIATAFIVAFLALVLIGVQFVKVTEANFIQPTPINHDSGIFIRSDGSIDPPTAPIQRVGDVYTFTGDVFEGIEVQRSDVIIDGKDHQLRGDNDGTALYLQSVINVIVQNVNIQGFSRGIYLHHTNRSTVQRNSVNGSGIAVTQRSCYNQILENNITDGGINVSFGNNNIVMDNDVQGVSIVRSTNITVKSNRIAEDGKREDVDMVHSSRRKGIDVDNSDNCNIIGNTIVRKIVGINIQQCTNLKFSNNTLEDNQRGFKLWGSDVVHNLHSIDTTNTVNGKPVYFLVNQADVRVPTNASWIVAINCVNITVENWTSTPNGDGILFVQTRDSKILNSKLIGNYNAIRFDTVTNCMISGNYIKNNGYVAFYFEGAVDCTITENNVIDNSYYFSIWHRSIHNTFYHNNFIGNWTGSPDSYNSYNSWDNGSEGNYWKQYNGTDADGDGIGDIPYTIDDGSHSVDKYPLMKPVEIPEPETPDVLPEFPLWTQMLLALAALTVALIVYKQRLIKPRNRTD